MAACADRSTACELKQLGPGIDLIAAKLTGAFDKNAKPPTFPARMVKSPTEDEWINNADRQRPRSG